MKRSQPNDPSFGINNNNRFHKEPLLARAIQRLCTTKPKISSKTKSEMLKDCYI